MPVRLRRGVDPQRSADIVEDNPLFDVAAAQGVIVEVAGLALRHSRRNGEDRFAAVEHHSEDTARTLDACLAVVGDNSPRRIYRAAANDDAAGALHDFPITRGGLLRFQNHFDVAARLRLARRSASKEENQYD